MGERMAAFRVFLLFLFSILSASYTHLLPRHDRPIIESVEPRFCGVNGGSVITIFGKGLYRQHETVTIKVGEENCPLEYHRSDPRNGTFVACRLPKKPIGSKSDNFEVTVSFKANWREHDDTLDVSRCTSVASLCSVTYRNDLTIEGFGLETTHVVGGDSVLVFKDASSIPNSTSTSLRDHRHAAHRIETYIGNHKGVFIDPYLAPLHFDNAGENEFFHHQLHMQVPRQAEAGKHPIRVSVDRLHSGEKNSHGSISLHSIEEKALTLNRKRSPSVLVHPVINYVYANPWMEDEKVGVDLHIHGSGFSATPSNNIIHFKGVPCLVLQSSQIAITCSLQHDSTRNNKTEEDYTEIKAPGFPLTIAELKNQSDYVTWKAMNVCMYKYSKNRLRQCLESISSEQVKMEAHVVASSLHWPIPHPAHSGGFRSNRFVSYGEAFFKAPFTGYYTLSMMCNGIKDSVSFEDIDICGFSMVVDDVVFKAAGSKAKVIESIFLRSGELYPTTITFLHQHHGDRFKLSMKFASDNHHAHDMYLQSIPGTWFTYTQDKSNGIDVVVNNVMAVCRGFYSHDCSFKEVRMPESVQTSRVLEVSTKPERKLTTTTYRLLSKMPSSRRQLLSAATLGCGSNDDCVIPAGDTYILDTSLDVGSLTINGKLEWDRTKDNLELKAGYILVAGDGTLEIGTSANRMLNRARIYIKNNGKSNPSMGKRFLAGMRDGASTTGPDIQIHGRSIVKTWSLLTQTANVGDNTIVLRDDVSDWAVGDKIVIAPNHHTSSPGDPDFAIKGSETFTIQSVSGNVITLDGTIRRTKHGETSNSFLGTFQAEVINLSRNIIITGDNIDGQKHGLHTMLAYGGNMEITYTRVEKCGQAGIKGRYCLHFHFVGDCPSCLFRGNAIEFSEQRGINIHSVHSSTSDQNVLHHVKGANIYIEDGNELENYITDNVAICHDGKWERVDCHVANSENTQSDRDNQSGLWALSVTNYFLRNRMVNQLNGFFTQTQSRPFGAGGSTNQVCTAHSPILTMQGNVHHTNWKFGTYLDNQFPRDLARTIATNGHVENYNSGCTNSWCTCNEFKPDGSDNGIFNVVQDHIDYNNAFVGQYTLGDVQYLRQTSVNNVNMMYWKRTKNFADGISSHIKDSTFKIIQGYPMQGSAGFLGPGGTGAFIVENIKYIGYFGEGALAANQHCSVGDSGTGGLCAPEYVLKNIDFSGVTSRYLNFGVSGGYRETPIFVSQDNSLFGYESVVNEAQAQLLSSPGGECQLAASVNPPLGYEFYNGIVCNGKVRRLQVWSGNQGELNLVGPLPSNAGYSSSTTSPSYRMKHLEPNGQSTRQGYGANVLTGYTYYLSVNRDFKNNWYDPFVTIEYSDRFFGVAPTFSEDEIFLYVNGQPCEGSQGRVTSLHSRNYIGQSGPSKEGVGACQGLPGVTPAPSPPTNYPTPQPTKDPIPGVTPAPSPVDSVGRVGINLSTKFQQEPLSATEAVAQLKAMKQFLGLQYPIEAVKFFDFDASISNLIAAAATDSDIKLIMLAIPNFQLPIFRTENLLAELANVINTYKNMVEFHVAVSNEPYFNGVQATDISNVITDIQSEFGNTVKITIPFAFGIMENSYPVNDGEFYADFTSAYGSIIKTQLDYISINPYSFFNVDQVGTSFDLEFLLGTTTGGTTMGMVQNKVNALRAALNRIPDFPSEFDIAIGEIGWPSAKNGGLADTYATIANAELFNKNFAAWIESDPTSSIISRAFIFEAYDEELKSNINIEGDDYSNHWGVFRSSGFPKTEPEPTPSPTRPVSDDCFKMNTDYYGNDITFVSDVDSAIECQEICQATNDCEYFSWLSESHTWIEGRKNCYLKDSNAPNNEQEDSNVISGRREACNLNPDNSSPMRYIGCLKKDEFNGLTYIEKKGSLTNDACLSHCKELGMKISATHNYYECTCLKTSDELSGKYYPESKCNAPCEGDRSEMCGGIDALSVYELREDENTDSDAGIALIVGGTIAVLSVVLVLSAVAVKRFRARRKLMQSKEIDTKPVHYYNP